MRGSNLFVVVRHRGRVRPFVASMEPKQIPLRPGMVSFQHIHIFKISNTRFEHIFNNYITCTVLQGSDGRDAEMHLQELRPAAGAAEVHLAATGDL